MKFLVLKQDRIIINISDISYIFQNEDNTITIVLLSGKRLRSTWTTQVENIYNDLYEITNK